jgi:hypothetical protein
MTASNSATRDRTTGAAADSTENEGPAQAAAAAARDIATNVADLASSAAARLPEATSATGASLERAAEMIRNESDEVLAIGTSLSLGMAVGLLLGGANRLLVILALIPATAMGFTLFDRQSGSRPTRSTRA